MDIPYLSLKKVHKEIYDELDAAWKMVFQRQNYIIGEECKQFELEFANYCGTKYCLGVGTGLDAIKIILMASNIGEGDEVIIPSNTFIATALAVSQVGAVPVFVEPDQGTYNINPDLIEEKITANTKAIIAVHLYGRIAPMNELKNIVMKRGLLLFEDACQAHGAKLNDKKAGNLSDAAAFSFYPGKNIGALGDGGAIVTNDKGIYQRAKMYRNYGSDVKYVHEYLGTNSRLDELQAAFLRVKLKYLDSWNSERKRIAKIYTEQITNKKLLLPQGYGEDENVFHIYPIMTQERDKLKAYLQLKGIMTQSHYPIPMHLQNAYKGLGYAEGDFPIAEYISNHELSVPLYPGLMPQEIEYIVNCLNAYE